MSDLFPDDPVAVQARRQAAVRGLSVRPDDPPLFDLGESFNAIRRGAYLADEGISGFGSRLANIPNTALETPSYFHQSEAQHRLTDPTSYERTDFAAWLDEQANVNRREIRRITPDPNSISQAQQILSGVLQPITAGLVGAPLGPAGPALTLGAGFGAQSYDEQIEAGVDPETAERVAIGQAGLGAVMGVLPASAPIRGARFALWPALGRAASGAAINVGTGIVMRQSVHDTLMASENGDYSAQAERYLALDGQALMVDAILGAAFGTIFAHVDSVGTAPRGRGEDGGPLPEALDDEPSAPILSAEEHLDAATEAYNDGDLVLARAHALMADRLGEQEGAFLAEQWAREGGEEAAVEGDALGLIMAMERGLIKPTPEQIHAAMVMGDDINARVTTAPGIPLNVHADVVHAENLRAYDEAAANGEEFPPARWDDGDAESFAPHPEDNFVATEAEDAIRNVLEQEGFSDLARDIETRRERIRSMGGAIDPGDMYFSRRGESAERRSEAFHDARLSPQQNKAVEMALNNYSNAEIADELDVSLAQVSVVLTNARRRAPNVEIEHARLGTTPGTHGGRRTATIEEIVALHNRLARQGYSNKLGNPVAGRRNLNTVIGERLGLSPKNIAKRLSEYRAGLRDGRIEGEALYSVARPGAGGRPNVNLNFIRRMLSEGETDLVKVTEALNEHRRELGMPPTTEQAVRSQAALDRRLNRTELNVATNEMQTTRRTGVEPSESAFKNMSRVLGAVESIARENGGAPPPGWQDAVAAETGYSPRSVSVLWDRIKAGEFGDELAARANTIPNAGRSRSAQRVLIGRLMDQGLSRQAITERVNVVRDSENKPPMTPQNVSSVMTQIRDARLNGDMRYSMTEDGTFSTPEDLKAAAIEAFGSDWNVLARAGNVEVVQTSADVPAGMFGLPRGVQAVHMRDTRTTYFIANNVRPEDMKGLILHEVGVHHGFEAMVGKRGFKEVLRQIERMIDADHPALVQARAFAERYSARDEHIPEETLAYLIETQADMPLVNSVLSKLRQWLVKTFGSTFGMQLTVDDLRALAITSLRRVAEQARREAGPAVEVLPIQDAVILASNGPDARPAQGGRRSPYQEELRAQGFDVESPLYRGMTRQAEGGDFTRNTDLQGSEQFHGTSFSRSTSEANLYAMEGDGGAVYPAYMRGRLESGPDYMRAVQARARESGVTNQEAARQVQQEYAQRGVTGVEWPPDRYGKGGEVRIFDQSNTASPFGANAPRTAPDGGPVQAGRDADGAALDLDRLKAEGWDTSRAWARVVPDTAADPWEVRPLGRFGPGLYFGDDVVEGQMTSRVNRIGARQGHNAASHRAYIRDGDMATDAEWREAYRRHSKGPLGERNPRDAEQRAVRDLEQRGFIGVVVRDRNDGSMSLNVFRRENILPVPTDGRSGPNGGPVQAGRDAAQRAPTFTLSRVSDGGSRLYTIPTGIDRANVELIVGRNGLVDWSTTRGQSAFSLPIAQRNQIALRAMRGVIDALGSDAGEFGLATYKFGATPERAALYRSLAAHARRNGFEMVETATGKFELRRNGPNAGDARDFPQFSFGGRNARTADGPLRFRAEQMEQSGRSREDIWKETGWARGDDGQWRFEIDTNEAALTAKLEPVEFSPIQRLDEVLDFPSLFEAYPQLRSVPVDVAYGDHGGNWNRHADWKSGEPSGEGPFAQVPLVSVPLITVRAKGRPSALSVLLHEVQHAIQDIEGFATGDNPARVGWDIYWRSAGEIEARDVQDRINLTREQRETIPPNSWTDVPKPERIVSLSNPGDAFSVQPPAPRQNADNLVGAKRDPIESPDYQRRLAEVRTRAKEGGYEEAGESGPGGLGGVRGDASARRSAGSNPASSPRPPRALIRDVLELSGIRLETKAKSVGFGSYRATIDTPFPSDADAALHGTQGVASYVDFDIRDGSNKSDAYPGLHIRVTNLNHAARGQRVSVWLYRQIIEWADRQGMAVYSDHVSISPEAQRTYAALRRRGYDIEVIARNADKDADGYIVNPDMLSETPIFRVSKIMPIDEALTGAGHPEGDYQIDGPTLRERQKVIDDQRARQEEYDKASPLEQVLKDDPNMMLSMGHGRSVKASEAIEMSVEAQQEAVAKKKAFEAAVRCAIRHGGSMAGRSFVTLGGRGASQAASASQLLGQGLGLTAAGPAAWAVSHAARRNADPLGYAVDRTNMAAEALRQEEARFAREGHQAGVNAGLDAPTGYDVPEGEPLWDNVDTSRRVGDAPPDSIEPPMQSSSNSNDPLRSGVAQGRDPGAWDQTTPTRYMAPGGGTTPNGARVPPAPPGLDDDK